MLGQVSFLNEQTSELIWNVCRQIRIDGQSTDQAKEECVFGDWEIFGLVGMKM